MANEDMSNPTLSNVVFSANSADRLGGGMHNGESSPTLNNVAFTSNLADTGGGMFNSLSNSMLTNVVFSGNSAASDGGGMDNSQSNPILTNVTFTGNSAVFLGNGMFNIDSDPTIQNSIFWGNGLAEIANIDPDSTPTIANSLVQGGCPGGSNCFGVIDENPLFVDADGADNIVGTSDDDLRLLAGSPAIDAGDNNADLDGGGPGATTISDLPTDLGGNSRVVDGDANSTATVDMGAFESPPPIIYVNDDAGGINTGINWADAMLDLQDALSYALPGSQIWVAAGKYLPGATETDTFQLNNGVEIYGGFEGMPDTEGNFGVRDVETFLSILSGDIEGNDITGAKGVVTDTDNIMGGNSDHVVTTNEADEAAVLDGFTITAGQADGGGFFPDNSGGGLLNRAGTPSIVNVIFSGNNAAHQGGGMWTGSGSPTLMNIEFSGNSAVQGAGIHNEFGNPAMSNINFTANTASLNGGGICNREGNLTLTTITFSGNAALNGGGIYNSASDPTLTNATFSGNSATNGGGIFNNNSNPTLTNVTFSGNSTINSGGGMFNISSSPTLINVTFSGNHGGSIAGGMINTNDSDPAVLNCIFWGNTEGFGGEQIRNGGPENIPILSNSIVQGGCPDQQTICANVIDADPLFVRDPDDGGDGFGVGNNDDFGDLRLQPGSPAMDMGNNAHLPMDSADLDGDFDFFEQIPFDLDGNPRIFNGTVDMGAYEIQVLPPTLTPTDTQTLTATAICYSHSFCHPYGYDDSRSHSDFYSTKRYDLCKRYGRWKQ